MFEVSGIRTAIDYLTFLHTTPIQRRLILLASHTNEAGIENASQQHAADAFRYAVESGFAFQAQGDAEQAALTREKELHKTRASQRQFELNVDAQLSQFTRYLSPGSASNYAERYLRVQSLLEEDITDAYLKLFCASHGVPVVLGIQSLPLQSGSAAPVNIPLFRSETDLTSAIPTWVDSIVGGRGPVRAPDILDALVLWTRATLRTIEQISQYESEVTVSIPLTQPSGKKTSALFTEAQIQAAFGPTATPDAPSHRITFLLDPDVLPFTTPIEHARVVGIGLSVVKNQESEIPFEYAAAYPFPSGNASDSTVQPQRTTGIEKYTEPKLARLNASITSPLQKSDFSTSYQRPTILIPNVRIQGGYNGDSDPSLYAPAACRNINPFSGSWSIALEKNTVLWFGGAGNSQWIAGFVLHLALRGTVR